MASTLSDAAVSEADRVHLLAEASKAAYRLRDSLIADPAHMAVRVQEILCESHIAGLRGRIRRDQASAPAIWDGPIHRDTVYITVVDRDRNCVLLINSIFASFGSGIYAPRSYYRTAEAVSR